MLVFLKVVYISIGGQHLGVAVKVIKNKIHTHSILQIIFTQLLSLWPRNNIIIYNPLCSHFKK